MQAGLWVAFLALVGMCLMFAIYLLMPYMTRASLPYRNLLVGSAFGLGVVSLAGVASQALIPRAADTWFYSGLSGFIHVIALSSIAGSLWIDNDESAAVMAGLAVVLLLVFLSLQLPALKNLMRFLRDANAEATLDTIKYAFLFAFLLLLPSCVFRPFREIAFLLAVLSGVVGYGLLVVQLAKATGRYAAAQRGFDERAARRPPVQERRDRCSERD